GTAPPAAAPGRGTAGPAAPDEEAEPAPRELPAVAAGPRRSERATAYARIAATARAAADLASGSREAVATFDTTHTRDLADQLGRLSATALRAAWSSEQWCSARAEELRDLADVPDLIATDGTWSVHWETGATPASVYSRANPPTGVLALDRQLYGRATRTATLSYTPHPGARRPRPGERVCRGRGGPRSLTDVADLLDARGPAPGRIDAVRAFAAATGLGTVHAALLLSPCVDFTWDNTNSRVWQADHHHFTELGLTPARIHTAYLLVSALTDETEHQELLDAAMPADPAELWSGGADAAAAAARWLARHPATEHLAEHLWEEVVLDHTPFARRRPAFLALLAPDGTPTVEGALPAAASLGYRLTPGTPPARTAAAHLRRLRATCGEPATQVLIGDLHSVARIEEAAGATALRSA
ncbi:hypothetical protein, partial [Marinitenerispora sediminis]